MINNELLLALTKTKAPRDEIVPGEYKGEAVVRVRYDIRVGEPYSGAVAASVPWMRVAAILFDKVNGATLESVLREALDLSDEACSALNDRAKTVKIQRGKVTGDVEITDAA